MDPDLLLLGVYYFLVFAVYLFFERVPVNYRPILIEGRLEASYPSSTTLLVLSVMPTLRFQICRRSAKLSLQKAAGLFGAVFSAFTVIGRFLAGVHWATDIIASILFSAGLFLIYRAAVQFAEKRG